MSHDAGAVLFASRRDQALLLVLRCQSGDESAFARLFEWFGARTLADLQRLVGDDGEDVQQDVWLNVYRNLRTLHNPRAFRTWLFQTTRRRAIDFLRGRKREQELRDDAMREMSTAVLAGQSASSSTNPRWRLPCNGCHRSIEKCCSRFQEDIELWRDRRHCRLLDRHRAIPAAQRQAAVTGRARAELNQHRGESA